jgi:integrase
VTIVPLPAPPADAPASGEIVTAAVDRYLDSIKTKTTRSSYAGTLARLVSRAGGRDTASLLPEDYAAVMDRWDDAAAATWNRHLSALTSFTAWAGRQEILTTNPGRRLERRKPARRGDRAIPRARLDKLLTDDWHGLRERVLWRMLYETAARAEELLSLNIEDLDLEFRRGRVTSKGGAIEYVHWATGTARLLPRLLRGRTSGPVFLAGRRARVRFASPCRGGRLPGDRTRTAVLPARRVPVQAGHRRPRPAPEGLDAPPAPPLRPPAPGRRRTHRPRTPGQIPASAHGQPRPVRPARRTDLRPGHRRRRPRSTTQDSLTKPD